MTTIECWRGSGSTRCRRREHCRISPAVFLLWPKEGEPYLSRTGVLRRRLLRLLAERERPSRLLNLRHTVARIEYRLTGSAFESSILLLRTGAPPFSRIRTSSLMKLRMPPYVKLVLNNEFPRSQITTHLTRTAGCISGPSARAPRRSGSKRSSWTCSRCAAARKTWCLRPRTPAASMARWRCACAPASRS